MKGVIKKLIIFATITFALSTVFIKSKHDPPPTEELIKLNYNPGEILVKLRKGVTFQELEGNTRFKNVEIKKRFLILSQLKGQECLLLKINNFNRNSESDIARILTSEPGVEAASLNYKRYLARIPNDPMFPLQWGLHNTGQTAFTNKGTPDADIDAPEAWETGVGSSNVVVAIVDTGVDYNHEDLKANMWKNSGETQGNNYDDDNNGYIDDVYGYDFASDNSGKNDPDPMDIHNHGTHIAGIIGAKGNNKIGISGICWNVKIMALKVYRPNGDIFLSEEIEAFEYIIKMKTQFNINIVAINCSFGGDDYNSFEKDIVEQAYNAGIIVCAAAGNGGSDGIGDSNDESPFYPASHEVANVISVAATNEKDELAYFSNYGKKSVDIAAPGVGIKSTVITGNGLDASVTANKTHFGAIPLEYSPFTNGITKTLYNCHMGINSSDFPAAVNGNIALIKRGDISFSEKTKNAQNAGAVAVIIYNNLPGNFNGTLGTKDNWIPTISIPQEAGQKLLDMGNPTVTFVIKTSDYDFMMGTSMATPHVSGAIALIAAKFPNEDLNKRISRIILGSDPKVNLQDKIKLGGRLNIASLRIQAPLNLSGQKVKNQSIILTEYINTLTWQKNPQNQTYGIVKFIIFQINGREFTLIDEVDSNIFEYKIRKVDKDSNYTYAVLAVDSNGTRGEPALITITNN